MNDAAPVALDFSNARPKKRSLTLRGHRTSVSVEDPFWRIFLQIAAEEDKPVNVLAAEIDAARGMDCGLASAIRLFVFDRVSRRGDSAQT